MQFIPINVDVNAKRADYSGLSKDALLVTSMFFTLQGEGPLAGKRALFLRTAGCNFGGKDVACGFCDTQFALGSGVPKTFDEIRARINEYDCGLLVITGGEPLLQPNIIEFAEYLIQNAPDLVFQFETNGTQNHALTSLVRLASTYAGRIVIVCSPKALNKTGYSSLPPMSRDAFVGADCLNLYYKFVVSADPKDQHFDIPEWAFAVAKKVYVSPITVYRRPVASGEVVSAWDRSLVNHEATFSNYRYAAQLALRYGFTVSVQMHTWLGLE